MHAFSSTLERSERSPSRYAAAWPHRLSRAICYAMRADSTADRRRSAACWWQSWEGPTGVAAIRHYAFAISCCSWSISNPASADRGHGAAALRCMDGAGRAQPDRRYGTGFWSASGTCFMTGAEEVDLQRLGTARTVCRADFWRGCTARRFAALRSAGRAGI